MKTLKPFLFVVAGMAIAFLIAFKTAEPKKEYLFLRQNGWEWEINFPDGTQESKVYKLSNYGYTLNRTINDLTNEGWEMEKTSPYGIHFSRTKQ